MAIYCNVECQEAGAICDFCIHYKDDNEGSDKGFAGEGFCEAKKIRVDACHMCEDDFHCFRADN
jgi:hypothetical protein